MCAKVLIVEDEFLVALDLEELLTRAGHEVVGVVPDRASLDRLRTPPEVALVDVNLRDGPSGPLIAEELSRGHGTRIVYVTASHSQIAVPAPTTVGVARKPFCEEEILLAVAQAVKVSGGPGPARMGGDSAPGL